MTVLVLRLRINLEEERRDRIATGSIFKLRPINGIGVEPFVIELNRTLRAGSIMELRRIRIDIGHYHRIHTRTIARVIRTDIGGIGNLNRISFLTAYIGRIPVSRNRRWLIRSKTPEHPASFITQLGSMVLIALELIHNMRSIRELKRTHTISQDILVGIFRNRETRCGNRTDLEEAIGFLNETYLAGICMKTSVYLK